MSKALVLGAAALALSAATASAQVYVTPGLRIRLHNSGGRLGAAPLRVCSTSLRLWRSGLWRAGHSRNDRCYRDASSGLLSAAGVRGTSNLHSTGSDDRVLRCTSRPAGANI